MSFRIIMAKLRVRLARLLNHALLGKHAGGLPGTVICLLDEMGGRAVKEYLVDMRKISPAQLIRHAFPDSCPQLFRREKAFDAKHVYFLRDVIGLRNMIWSNLPCEIFETLPFNLFNECYARLVTGLGFGYNYVVCG